MKRRARSSVAGVRGVVKVSLFLLAAVPLPGAAQEWSPDTASVAWAATSAGETEIFVRRGGGPPQNVTRSPGLDQWPRVSPDGRWLLFTSARTGNREVYRLRLDDPDAEPVRLTDDPGYDILAEWSPDGSRVAFFSTRGLEPGPGLPFPGHLYVMDAWGGEPRRVTARPMASPFGGSWSPDGRSLVLTRGEAGGTDLFLLDLASGEETRLTDGGGNEGAPAFSPDGRSVAYYVGVGDESRIAVLDLETGASRTLSSGRADYYPSWSPDGRWLLVTSAPVGGSSHDLLALPVAGGEPVVVIATDADERGGAWLPTAEPGPRAPGSRRSASRSRPRG